MRGEAGRCGNYIPARMSGWLMVAAAFLSGVAGTDAWNIYSGDRRKHASDNAAQKGPEKARKPQLRADGVGLRGGSGRAACGKRILFRETVRKTFDRRYGKAC